MSSKILVTALAATVALTQVLPSPAGPYEVRWQNKELVDASRLDPWNSSHVRRIMISQFTPVPTEHCRTKTHVPYMPELVAAVEDEILSYYYEGYGWPVGLLGALEVEVCDDADTGASNVHGSRFPTVLFGTGANTTRLWYTGIAQQIASLGYQVIVMDHPYETDVVLFPNGDVIYGGALEDGKNNLTAQAFGLEVRNSDVALVLNTFKVCSTVYFGHSYGGAAALYSTAAEPRVRGGLNLDGSLWGPIVQAGVSKPFINFSGGQNTSNDDSWREFYEAQDTKHPDAWGRQIHLEDSMHGSFWDLPIIGDVAGLRDNATFVEVFLGDVTGQRVVEVLRTYFHDYIEFLLHGADEGVLAGESEAIPDVDFVRIDGHDLRRR